MADINSRTARDLLARVDRNVLPKVKRNEEIVCRFADVLRAHFQRCPSSSTLVESKVMGPGQILRGAHVMHSGSAYENLEVNDKTDFDIIIVLNKPYVFDNFEVIRDPSKYFSLRWRDRKGHSDWQGYLDAQALQNQLFHELSGCLDQLGPVNGIRTVSYKKGLAALTVTITTNTGTTISVDLAPQITVRRWAGSPDLVPRQHLPITLQNYIATLEANVSPVYYFTPAVPGHHHNQQRLCNISFSMLEKEFLKSNPGIRDIVRLVKLVGEACNWKGKYGLKSFIIKRVAVKHAEDLQGKSLWEGYKALVAHMWRELESNTFDGFFVKEQPIYHKKPRQVAQFRNALAEAHNWDIATVKSKIEGELGLY